MNLLLLTSLLTTPQANVTIHGVPVVYVVVEPAALNGHLGAAQFFGGRCIVSISKAAIYAGNIAHELGHCLDAGRSNRFGNAGCRLREYACPSAEGYADTYALLYLEKFGSALAPLGWFGESGDLPHPNEATVDALMRFVR